MARLEGRCEGDKADTADRPQVSSVAGREIDQSGHHLADGGGSNNNGSGSHWMGDGKRDPKCTNQHKPARTVLRNSSDRAATVLGNVCHPAPKRKRVADRSVIEKALWRDSGICLVGMMYPGVYGPCTPGGVDPHHMVNRGAGGDDDLTNLISLCRHHHDLAQARRISLSLLRGIMSKLYGYRYD